MNLHQVLTGAVNPGDHCFSVGSVGDQRFTVSEGSCLVARGESAPLSQPVSAQSSGRRPGKPGRPCGGRPRSRGSPDSLGSADLAFENGGGNSTLIIELLDVYRDYTRKLECFVGFFQVLI